MKPLETSEIAQIVIDLQTLVGAQLQEVMQSGSNIGLGFYHERKIDWLWFDLNPRAPAIVRLSEIPKFFKKEVKPLSLFIKSHFVGSRIKSITTSADLGRIFEIHFAGGVLQVRLFPRGQNFIAVAEDKRVSFDKIKELQASGPTQAVGDSVSSRTWAEIEDEWKSENKIGQVKISSNQASDPRLQAEKQFAKDLEKKERALEKMRDDLKSKQDQKYRQAGEFLKTLLPKEFPELVPESLKDLIKKDESLSSNIESLFKRAKDNERKLEGSRERILKLEEEIKILREKGPLAIFERKQASAASPKKKTLLEAAQAKGRKLQVAEDLEVYIGKSAADNLALLRRAQPFDYWLHLRDYPGTHAILRRTRNRVVSDAELQTVGKWVVQQSLHKTTEQLSDSRYDVLLVECRFVRPIKGDKLGRVNYSNDRVFVVRF